MDYTTLAYENMLETLPDERALIENKMLVESEFILSCLESGYISSVLEASDPSLFQKVKTAFQNFIAKIVAVFVKSAAERQLKYRQWAVDNEAELKKKAAQIEEITMSPYYNKSSDQVGKTLKNAIKKAYSVNNYDDASWATSMISEVKKISDLKDVNNTAGRLKNYFRFGVNTDNAVKQQTIDGSVLSTYVGGMVAYLKDYNKVAKELQDIENISRTSSDQFARKNNVGGGVAVDTEKSADGTVKESATDSFLSVEGVPLCESDLSGLLGYTDLMEASVKPKIPGAQGSSPVGTPKPAKSKPKTASDYDKVGQRMKDNDKSSISTGKSKLANDTGGKVTGKDGTQAAVQSVKIEKGDAENAPEKKADKANPKKQADQAQKDSEKYFIATSNFLKVAIAAYQTACDERFLVYVKILVQIMGKGPKFDKNGKYIPEGKANKEDETTDIDVTKTDIKEKEASDAYIPDLNQESVIESSRIPLSFFR